MAGADPGPRAGRTSAFLRATGSLLLRLPRALLALLVLCWGGLIWYLSGHSVPSPEGQSWFWELASNLAHAPLFGILGLLVAAGILRPEPPQGWPVFRGARVALVLVLVVGYGALDEWHQSRTPGRSPALTDLLTDLAGVACVLWIVFYLGQGARSERGLLLRLLAGALVCSASAALATLD
jgi:VanZ family protein